PVNRMSPGDSGLVLFTNDGRLANALMRSAASLPAVYMVRAHPGGGTPAPEALSTTVNLDEGPVQFEAVEAAGGEGANQWFRVVAQGADRRHAVRALFESQDMTVSRVSQLRFADVELPRDLPRGRHRRLSPEFVARLYERAGLEAPLVEDKKPAPRRTGTRRGASQSPAADRPRRGKPPTRKRR
ncbi:MAG TPA: hypothetical protein VLT59_03515, partial [Steroidobacteraceae bacterium]|nr:hypothetical protein [Steroidobacteraceae bacterium]